MAETELADRARDYRARLYECYVRTQLRSDAKKLRQVMEQGSPYLQRLVKQFIPPDRATSILDLGCGFGNLLQTLKNASYNNICGLDVSPEQVQIATELGIERVLCGDILEFLVETTDSTWDVITAIDVVEHFSKDEVLVLLDHVHRVLKPAGILILHVPNGEAIFSGKIFFGDFTHQVAFTHKSISQVAACAGFIDVSCYEDAPIAHGFLSGLRLFLWMIIRSRYRIINAIETGEPGKDLILSQNMLVVCKKGEKIS